MIDEKDDRMVPLHAGEHYQAVVPPAISITKDKDLLQMMSKYVAEDGAPLPSTVNAPALAPAHITDNVLLGHMTVLPQSLPMYQSML